MHSCWNNESPILVEDFEYIISDATIPWASLKDRNILITGATGLIGSLLVKSLLYAAEVKNLNITVLAFVRSKAKAEEIFKAELESKNSKLQFALYDTYSPISPDYTADYIIHAASPTDSMFFIERPVDTITTIVNGTYHILDFAVKSKCKGLVFLSSMEVYGKLNHEKVTEDDSGYLDPLNVRNSYPQAKRIAESLCAAFASQYNLHVNIVRLTQTFGPGVNSNDNRVFMQFARCIKEGKDIILHTPGKTKRDYLYTADAVRGILSALLCGNKGEAYNLSNPDSYISIYDMAKMCLSLASHKINIVFDISPNKQKQYLQEIQITLDGAKMAKINNFEKKNLKEMFKRMIRYLN